MPPDNPRAIELRKEANLPASASSEVTDRTVCKRTRAGRIPGSFYEASVGGADAEAAHSRAVMP